MGAWGAGNFDNDTAWDWAHALEEAHDLSLVEEAIGRVLEAGGYLDAPDAEEAIAAAEVIARLQGNPGDYAEKVDEWVSENKFAVSAELAKKSHTALERILGADSELAELWGESESFDEWKAAVTDLKARIRV